MKELLAILLLMSSAAAGWAEIGVTDKQILIGSCSDRSTEGQKARSLIRMEGAKAYFDHVNEQGGIYGRKIALLEKDDANDSEQAIVCFNNLVASRVFASAFFIGGPTAAKYAPMSESNKIPALGFIAGANFLYNPVKKYVFNVRGSYDDMIEGTVGPLWDAGARRIGIIFAEDAFGAGAYEALRLALKKRSAEPVAAAGIAHGSSDVNGGLAQLKAARPQVVVLALTAEPSAAIFKRSAADQWKPIFISISNNPEMFKLSGSAIDGVVIPEIEPTADRTDLPAIVLYQKLLKRRFPASRPNSTSLEGFTEAMIIVDGIKRAGKGLTRDGFVAGLESMKNVDLGFGPGFDVRYDAQDHKAFHSIYPTLIRSGKPVLIEDWSKLLSGRAD